MEGQIGRPGEVRPDWKAGKTDGSVVPSGLIDVSNKAKGRVDTTGDSS